MARAIETLAITDPNKALFDRFNNAPLAVAVQKNGALTEISRQIIGKEFGIDIPQKPPIERIPLAVTTTVHYGEVGIYYAKNKSLGSLIADGTADFGIVGTDRVFEEELNSNPHVLVAQIFPKYQWDIVLAAPKGAGIKDLSQVQTVATQYPKITEDIFARNGNPEVRIVKTEGGTETYARNRRGTTHYDAVVDLSDTGRSLRAHGLEQIGEPLTRISPTLVFSARSIQEKSEVASMLSTKKLSRRSL